MTETFTPSELKRELEKLSRLKDKGGQAKAALFNLIVYTHNSKRGKYFKEIIEEIVRQFPCRLFFIEGDLSMQEDSIELNIALGNELEPDAVGGEGIFIRASGKELGRVPFLILPHLITDLPNYLLWGEDPSRELSIFPRLHHLASRIIFDSECAENLEEFSKTLLKFMATSTAEIVDMNWIRTSGWRQIITRAFDAQTRLDLLNKTTELKITYNSRLSDLSPNPETQGIYLHSWIATCLGWKLGSVKVKDNVWNINYSHGEVPIAVELQPEEREDIPPEEVLMLRLATPDEYDCKFTRKSLTQLEVKASSKYQCLLPFSLRLATLDNARTMMQEIFYKKISRQYLKMLQLISQGTWR